MAERASESFLGVCYGMRYNLRVSKGDGDMREEEISIRIIEALEKENKEQDKTIKKLVKLVEAEKKELEAMEKRLLKKDELIVKLLKEDE